VPESGSLEELLAASVRHLALPGDEALAHKPLGDDPPDELALEFDDLYTAYVDRLDALPTPEQLGALQALDSALTAMSGGANAELWTEAAVKHHPRWDEIRTLATAVLEQFGWAGSH
jgi:hypothetical protein